MNEISRFYDLRTKGKAFGSSRHQLPDRIVTPTGETFQRINLPGVSLSANFLASADRRWIGLSVNVHTDSIDLVWEMFASCSPSCVRRILPQEVRNIRRYRELSSTGIVEVEWRSAEDVELVEVLTDNVLWYANPVESGYRIEFVGLENLHRLCNEPESPLLLPEISGEGE